MFFGKFSESSNFLNILDKGSKIIIQTMKFNDKRTMLRYSYTLISFPISSFPSIFPK